VRNSTHLVLTTLPTTTEYVWTAIALSPTISRLRDRRIALGFDGTLEQDATCSNPVDEAARNGTGGKETSSRPGRALWHIITLSLPQ